MLDEEPADAGADALTAAPMCPYQPEPLGACEGFASPEPACVVDVDGRTELSQVSFDAAGRRIGETSDLSVSRSAFDHTGRVVRRESAEDGCVSSSTIVRPLGDGWLTHRRDRGGEGCSYEMRSAEVMRHEVDPDCDCRDVLTLFECEVGPHGPVRCVWYEYDGALSGIWTYIYDAAGHRVSERVDRDGDGVHEAELTYAFDAEGRLVEQCGTCTDCGEPERVCWTFVYEEDPRRVTEHRDEGGDGLVERIERTTYDDEDRIVLEEFGEDGVANRTRIETVYDDRGGYHRTWTRDGRVTLTEELVIEGGRRTRTRTAVDDDGQSVDITVAGAHGGLIEHFGSVHNSRGDLIVSRHAHYSRDARGLLTGYRSRAVTGRGQLGICTIGYRWSGPCPVPPVDYDGEACLPSEQ